LRAYQRVSRKDISTAPRSNVAIVVSNSIDNVANENEETEIESRHGNVARIQNRNLLIHKCVSLYETHYHISVDQRVTKLLEH